ncbi:serine-rich adhesin for platelets isoform X2 [Anopheles funestus]|uniref:serine-rich adhesin for platelets isoform X2 n=1 Tax=Anopheles funestus TaxID=62324 RepID=UPI0020C678B7|nr:serine-rich adhesin for platelets isoform X2 [Anopheles funestus]
MDVDSPNALKRCSSAPQINNLLPSTTVGVQPMEEGQSQPVPNTSGNSNSITTTHRINSGGLQHQHLQQVLLSVGHSEQLHTGSASMLNSHNFHQGSTATGSRESLPTSFSNIFTPRVRRFSASFSPLAVISNGSASPGRNGSGTPGPRLTPRISQLRQEECADVSNSREVNHEREIHTAMQMSQSCEDLTLVAENWSFSSGSAGKMVIDDLQNPLHVALPTIGSTCCSSPSPTSRGGIGLQYPTTSPSPTRKFVTRRSMSPCPLRPSPLSSSVKRKFDLEDNYGNCYSPPSKKIFSSERGTSPVCQTPSPSPICPSPDSSTTSFENGSNNNNNNGMGSNVPLCGPFPLAATTSSSSGRITPKFFLTKLTGIPSPGATICSTAPFGTISTMHFGGNSGSSSACSTPTGTTNPIVSLGGGNATLMMDCGVSSSTGGGTECRDSTMEVSHTVGANMYEDRSMAIEEAAGEARTKGTVNSDSIKMACDENETNISDNQRRRRLTIGPSVAISASRELREQVLKSALDPDAAGSCNSNSSNSSSTSSSSSNSSNSSSSSGSSSSTTSDSNNSANTNSSRMSSLAGVGPGGNVLDSSSNTSTSSVDTGGGTTVASAGTAAAATICPSLTSFPMMAIPSNLAEIAES